MDLTPFLSSLEGTTLDQVLLSVAISGKVAIAMKGRFLQGGQHGAGRPSGIKQRRAGGNRHLDAVHREGEHAHQPSSGNGRAWGSRQASTGSHRCGCRQAA